MRSCRSAGSCSTVIECRSTMQKNASPSSWVRRVLAEAADQVAEVLLARGLDAGEDAHGRGIVPEGPSGPQLGCSGRHGSDRAHLDPGVMARPCRGAAARVARRRPRSPPCASGCGCCRRSSSRARRARCGRRSGRRPRAARSCCRPGTAPSRSGTFRRPGSASGSRCCCRCRPCSPTAPRCR